VDKFRKQRGRGEKGLRIPRSLALARGNEEAKVKC
jgi:hypothetical protein